MLLLLLLFIYLFIYFFLGGEPAIRHCVITKVRPGQAGLAFGRVTTREYAVLLGPFFLARARDGSNRGCVIHFWSPQRVFDCEGNPKHSVTVLHHRKTGQPCVDRQNIFTSSLALITISANNEFEHRKLSKYCEQPFRQVVTQVFRLIDTTSFSKTQQALFAVSWNNLHVNLCYHLEIRAIWLPTKRVSNFPSAQRTD